MVDSMSIELALSRAGTYLNHQFQLQGSHWEDFPSHRFGTGTEWITGFVGCTLFADPHHQEMLHQAADFLLDRQRDGAWGYSFKYFTDADSTSLCALFLNSQRKLPHSMQQVAINFLLDHQNADGGFSTFNNEEAMKADERFKVPSFAGWCNSHNSVTAIATRTLIALGISWQDQRVRSAINFLLNRQQENGLWNDYWWQGPFYTTYLATHLLSSDPVQDHQNRVQCAFDSVAASQLSAGFWTCREDNAPCGFSTALAVKSLLSANSPQYDNVILKGLEWLLENQNEQGFWVSPPILQIPRPDVLVPDPINVNREQEAHFVFTTGAVYSTLLSIRDWICASKNARVA